jgi:hypothetical protein
MAKPKPTNRRRSTAQNPDFTVQLYQQQLDAARTAGDRMAELDALAELGRAYSGQRATPVL